VKNKDTKQKSTLFRDAIALFLITLVSGLALSYVYEITKSPIAVQQEQKVLKANQAVFTAATSFAKDEELMKLAETTDLTSLNADYEGITIDEISKAYDANKEAIGYNITVSTSQGYSDIITMVIGYSEEGVIQGIEMLSIKETAGLGMKAKELEFRNQYIGKEEKQFVVTKTGATSENQIDAISGATITSKAVTNAVNAGIGFMAEYATDLGGGQ